VIPQEIKSQKVPEEVKRFLQEVKRHEILGFSRVPLDLMPSCSSLEICSKLSQTVTITQLSSPPLPPSNLRIVMIR
jgi:hypothetical protein